ncbi:unnamed protein product [Arabis nemorensis]|uniref:Importin subunit alpha n=1 Tax=Arabis nemorensis TaxID=586526 RepID=A0A565C028_9BRAS|nr:unnamed protein product [Arabis nemorensis]
MAPRAEIVRRDHEKDMSSVKIAIPDLPLMLGQIWTDDKSSQLEGTIFFRKLLSMRNRPINGVISIGAVPRFVKFLADEEMPKLQLEAACVLNSISSGTSDYKKVVAESGALSIFIKLLGSSSEDVCEQAVRALGNVAANSPKYRDVVLNHNAMLPLLSHFNEHSKLSMQRIATWTLANLCRGKPQPSFEQIKPAIPVLERLLQSTDEEVLKDACSALSYLSDESTDIRQAVIDAGVIPHLINILCHPSPSVLVPALRTIGNIVTSRDDQTQMVLNHQVLHPLLNLLTNNSYKKIVKKSVLDHLQHHSSWELKPDTMIDAGIIQSLVLLLQTADFKVKKEAAVGISNVTARGTEEQIRFMVSQGCIEPVCNLLTCPEPSIITVCLEALEKILIVGEAEKNLGDILYASIMIDDAKVLEKIEQLQNHDNNDIHQKVVKIIETFGQKTEKATNQL